MSISRFNAVEKASNRKAVEAITPNQKVSEYYGENVFNRKAMQKYLSKETYKALTHAIDNGTPIDREIANHVAAGMRMWALEKGVTHYTHWFQPLTGVTAEKHDSFISAPLENGKVLMSFFSKNISYIKCFSHSSPVLSSIESTAVQGKAFQLVRRNALLSVIPLFLRNQTVPSSLLPCQRSRRIPV